MSLNAHLARLFIQNAKCRHTNLTPSISAVNTTRRWLSNSTTSAHAPKTPATELEQSPSTAETQKVAKEPKTTSEESEAAEVPEGPRRRGRPKGSTGPRKPKKIIEDLEVEHEQSPSTSETPEVAKEPETTSTEIEAAEIPEGPPRRGRPRKGEIRPPRIGPRKPIKPIKVIEGLEVKDSVPESLLVLPPADQWHIYFPYKRDWTFRTTLSNINTARQLAEQFVPEGSKDKIVIEVNPGPGQLSRALLALPKERIKKLIIIEDAITFLPAIDALAAGDPRVVVVRGLGKQWSTYSDMEAAGILDDVQTLPWQKEHDQLQIVMHIPIDTHGEQLVSQLMRAVPDRLWLFKYGRIPMNFVLTTRMWERVSAKEGTGPRCKVSAIAEATTTFTETLPTNSFLPHWENFHPTRFGQPQTVQMTAATVVPKAHQIIARGDLDVWDYCLRRMFVLKAKPLKTSINTLGPGANNLIPKLSDPSIPEAQRVDPSKSPRELTAQEWETVINVFKRWPFKPTDLNIEIFQSGRHR